MNKYSKFADKICHVNWHEEEDKEKSIEALENIIRVKDRNYLEALDYAPLIYRQELNQNHDTRRHFIEKLIDLIKELPIVDRPSRTTVILEETSSTSSDSNSAS